MAGPNQGKTGYWTAGTIWQMEATVKSDDSHLSFSRKASKQEILFDSAIWRSILPCDRILTEESDLARYTRNCSGVERRVATVLLALSVEEISKIVKLADHYTIPLYPISCGRNWGYGSAAPTRDGCTIVDLSGMNRILAFQPENGLVTVEPGVTQQQLAEFLKENKYSYLVPTTGAGPRTSILGNALERGFGLTPYADHFGAVMGLEAVLPDGTLYRSPFSELGATELDRCFKWKIGPYLDGLFAQGNFGIVSQMTIALAKGPARVTACLFQLSRDELLEPAVEVVRDILQDFSANVGGLNLMNDFRVLSMDQRAPEAARSEGRAVSLQEAQQLFCARKISPWTGVATLYGTREVVSVVQKCIGRRLRKLGVRPIFLNRSKIAWIRRLMRFIPFLPKQFVTEHLQKIEISLRLFEGEPAAVALKLVHWRSQSDAGDPLRINPDEGDIGLLWYAPVLPFRADCARQLTRLIQKLLPKYGFDPLITYTAFSGRCLECTVPILYNSKSSGQARQARACYEEIFEQGRKLGFLPYRTGVQFMNQIVDVRKPFWRVQALIKQALDPNNLIAPGRYSAEVESEQQG